MTVNTFGILVLGVADQVMFGSQDDLNAEPVKVLVYLLAVGPFLITRMIFPVMAILFLARIVTTTATFRGMDFRDRWHGILIERSMDEKSSCITAQIND